MPFLVGGLTLEQYERSNVKRISHLRQLDELQDDDVVEFLGYALAYDSASLITEKRCTSWRRVADPACDSALSEVLKSSLNTGKDLFESVQRCAREHPDSEHSAEFLSSTSRIPPSDIVASAEDVVIAQDFFADHLLMILIGFVYFALPSGFASPRVLRTLDAISYLPRTKSTESANTRVVSRFVESIQFFSDVMGCTEQLHDCADPERKLTDLLPGGEAWKSIVRVRLLHAVVRRRVAGHYRRQTQLASETSDDDAPISQEDMIAALAAFGVIGAWTAKRLGLDLSDRQRAAYLALWRHIGFYLGIPDDVLRQYFRSTAASDKFVASMFLNLFSDTDAPSDETSPNPTKGVLAAALSKFPKFPPLSWHFAAVHHLVGAEIAQLRGIAPPSLPVRLAVRAIGFTLTFPVRFGKAYPRRGWMLQRRALVRTALVSLIRWGMGTNHTTYFPRAGMPGKAKSEEEDAGLPPVASPWLGLLWSFGLLYLELTVVVAAVVAAPALAVWCLILYSRHL